MTHHNLSESTILNSKIDTISLQKTIEQDYILIDVRSSGEYEDGAIEQAINIPLFDNYERSVVGTIYKHGSKQNAIAQGFEFVKNKFPELIHSFLPYQNKTLVIYCAKGGMRSRAIVNLLQQVEYKVFQLEGGYRKYRHETLDYLQTFDEELIVLHGLTGTGKTRLIENLSNAIDLEGLAQHRSSLFGGLNLTPRTQKQFESNLSVAMRNLSSPPYFIEGESTKLGGVFLPKSVAQSMQKGVMIKVNASLETRIARIIEDYPIFDDEMREKIRQTLLTLRKRLGKMLVDKLCTHLEKNELEPLVQILLTEYYDKRYGNMYKKYSFALEISSENINEAVEQLEHYRKSLVTPSTT